MPLAKRGIQLENEREKTIPGLHRQRNRKQAGERKGVSFCNLPFEQGRHKPVQVEHEHFAHARILFAVRGQLFRAAAGAEVVLADKFRSVLHHARRKQAEP